MSSSLTASMQARRHPETTHIDRLATADMLAMLHQDDKQISEAVGACLPDIARLIDIATATISRGGRLVIIGAPKALPGRTAIEAGQRPLFAGRPYALVGRDCRWADGGDGRAGDCGGQNCGTSAFEAAVAGLQQPRYAAGADRQRQDAMGVGAMRHAWSLGATIAVITQQPTSEGGAALADIIIAPQTGPEAVAGLANPRLDWPRGWIVNMLTTGLAIRDSHGYGNLRVDVQADSFAQAERQIAIVMAATDCATQ